MIDVDPAKCPSCGNPWSRTFAFKVCKPAVIDCICEPCGRRATFYAVADPSRPENLFATAEEASAAMASPDRGGAE